MTKCFSDGQYIRHVIGVSGVWQGIYNRERNKIIGDQATNGDINIEYKSLSSFAQAHYRAENSNRATANGWAECECYVNGQWISTYNLCEL
jgi:hypothetical protein